MSAERPLTSQPPMTKPKPMPDPNRAPRRCPLRRTELVGAHAASSNHDAASMRRHIANKESR
jgi:hypothetical protein